MNALNDELPAFARAIVRGNELSCGINSAYPNYTAATAIDVYRNNYRGNLHDALAGAYPVIEHLVGKDFFRRLTRAYIEQHPSRSGNLHHYGEQMAVFIADFLPAKQLVYLSDVAALEWACHSAYFAADAGTLDTGKLSRLGQEHYSNLVLVFHPACHVVHSRYPVADIWHAHQPGAPGDFHIDLDSGPSNALVIRKDDAVLVSELADADAEWLDNIRNGRTLGVATEVVIESHPDFDLQACLVNIVGLGVFTDFYVGESS
ncbi:MAG: DNA-binding domain-containing protein [Pseudomonadota bacterium]